MHTSLRETGKNSFFPNMQKKYIYICKVWGVEKVTLPTKSEPLIVTEGSLKYGYPVIQGVYVKPSSMNAA